MSKPLLVPFEEKAQYRPTTDASEEGLRAVLEEVQEIG